MMTSWYRHENLFPRHWRFVVDSPTKIHSWMQNFEFSLLSAWKYCLTTSRVAGDLRRYAWWHRPYSRQVTERMGCDVVIHPPPSIYPKAGNGALRDQWAIKYNCKNDSSTIAFTVLDLVHWNYVISQNIPRVWKSWELLSIYVFAAYIFFVHPTLSPLK